MEEEKQKLCVAKSGGQGATFLIYLMDTINMVGIYLVKVVGIVWIKISLQKEKNLNSHLDI